MTAPRHTGPASGPPRPPPLRRALAALAALALLAAPVQAATEGPLRLRLGAVRGRAVAALDLGSVFGAGLERELGNGLTNVVEIYTAVVGLGGGAPVSIHGRVVEILYDVWEETYALTVKDPEHPAGWRLVLPDFAALRAFLSDQRDVDLGPVAGLPEGGFSVEARVEVNPVSREQLQRTREYIAAASGARTSGSRSVLGAVASFLLREPDARSDVHLLRSGPLTRAAVTSR